MLQRGMTLFTVVAAAAAVLVGTSMLFLVNRPTSLAKGRVGCASNMRTIWQASLLYAADQGRGDEAPELKGFAYTYGWNWMDTLEGYGEVSACLHCPSEPENLKAVRSTYGYHLRHNQREDSLPPDTELGAFGKRSTDKRMMTMNRVMGSAMPIVSCQVHDELEAFFTDPAENRMKMNPMIHWIGADGRIRFERAEWQMRLEMSQIKVGNGQ